MGMARLHPTDLSQTSLRIHEIDPVMRHVWHGRPQRVQDYIPVCFLANALWKAPGLLCNRAGLGDEPRKVFTEQERTSLVDGLYDSPTDQQAFLLETLGLDIPTYLEFAYVQ